MTKASRPGREARNEQRKLTAQIFNALSNAFSVAAVPAPIINPKLGQSTGFGGFLGLMLALYDCHLLARAAVGDVEDR